MEKESKLAIDDGTTVMKASDYSTVEKRIQILQEPDTDYGSMELESIERSYLNKEMCAMLSKLKVKSKRSKKEEKNREEDDSISVDAPPVYFVRETLQLIPAFNKIEDEPLVNIADHWRRNTGLTVVKIYANQENGWLEFYNNGNAPPCQPSENNPDIYVPHQAWFLFNSGTSFKQKTNYVGSKNGVGSTLCSVASVESHLEIKDHRNNVHYKQSTTKNMETIHKPILKPIFKTTELHQEFLDQFNNSSNDSTVVVVNPKKRKNPSTGAIGNKDFVSFRFLPDFQWYEMAKKIPGYSMGIDANHMRWFISRCVDLASQLGEAGVKVYFNDHCLTSLCCKNFKEYIQLHTVASTNSGNDFTVKYVMQEFSPQWVIAVKASEDGKFHQTSFVNSIDTRRGGRHVDYIVQQLVGKARTALMDKHYKASDTKNMNPKEMKTLSEKIYNTIKKQMHIFIRALIIKPKFDTQSKEYLTTTEANFHSQCIITDDFVSKVVRLLNLDEKIIEWKQATELQAISQQLKTNANTSVSAEALATQELLLKNQVDDVAVDDEKIETSLGIDLKTMKLTRLSGIPKLEDALEAGGKNGKYCTFIPCEGDSAKALVVAGLTVVGRKRFGVFPLKGKPLNVRLASMKDILENEEIMAMVAILGLEFGVKYDTAEKRQKMRYGHVMIMTDGDKDGSHIKGLIINLFARFWPELLAVPEFMSEFITQIITVTRAGKEISFYTLPEFEMWKEQNNGGKGWVVKYFKGLGTSTANMAKKYFKNIHLHRLYFHLKSEACLKALEMAFGKDADARKRFVDGYVHGTYLEQKPGTLISYEDFVYKELILFSVYSNERSFINIIDGMKDCQRKIMYVVFKFNIVADIKVAQLGNKTAENTDYHHGENSLCDASVNMAQDFPGSGNNLELLFPNGMFGSRAQAGKDSANTRYIFTYVTSPALAIFPAEHNGLLVYHTDGKSTFEPYYFIPTVPVCLFNESDGIGTGYRSKFHCHHPKEVSRNMRHLLSNEPLEQIHPWYSNFTGTVAFIAPSEIKQAKEEEGHSVAFDAEYRRYYIFGKIEQVSQTELWITELPPGHATEKYDEFLKELLASGKIEAVVPMHGDDTVKFVIYLSSIQRTAIETALYEQEDQRKTTRTKTKPKEIYQSLESVTSNLYWFFQLWERIGMNEMIAYDENMKMKHYQSIEQIQLEFYAFRLEKYKLLRGLLIADMRAQRDKLRTKVQFIKDVVEERLKVKELNSKEIFQYFEAHREQYPAEQYWSLLLELPIVSLTPDRVPRLINELKIKESELESLEQQTAKSLWLKDLDNFDQVYDNYQHEKVYLKAQLQLELNEQKNEEKLQQEENKPKKKTTAAAAAKGKPRKNQKKQQEKEILLAENIITPNQVQTIVIQPPSVGWMLRREFPRKVKKVIKPTDQQQMDVISV